MTGDFETDVEVIFQKNENGFIVCSSLKKQYRDILRQGSPNVHFLWLDGDYETILAPMQIGLGILCPWRCSKVSLMRWSVRRRMNTILPAST